MNTVKFMSNKTMQRVALGAALLALSGLGSASAETFKLTAGSSHPPIVPWAKALPEVLVKKSVPLAAAKGHTLKWTEAYSGALYNFQNTLEGVEDGLADFGWVGSLWEPSKLPLQNVSYFAPFMSNDVALLTKLGNRLNNEVPVAAAAWKKYNQVPLGLFAAGPYVLITKKPVNSVADLKGLKLYTPGGVSRWVKGTGAVGVDAGLPIVYEGIRNGVTSGAILPVSSLLPFKLHEVAPYVTHVKLGAALAGALTVNLDTWNKFPPELKSMFRDIGKEYSEFVVRGVTGFGAKTIAVLKKNPKVTVTTLPDAEMKKWASLVPDIAGDWVRSTGPDAAKVLKFFMTEIRKAGGTPLRDWDKQ